MTTRVKTESGTSYLFEGDRVRREGGFYDESAEMRRDGEWLQAYGMDAPQVGKTMLIVLEPLGEGNVTYRRTTRVVSIEPNVEQSTNLQEEA